MTSYRRSPRRAAIALDHVRSELAPDTLLAEVQQGWREAVGAAIALEARPTRERGGVITVSCSASVWAQELDLMAPAIVERLNRPVTLGAGLAAALRRAAGRDVALEQVGGKAGAGGRSTAATGSCQPPYSWGPALASMIGPSWPLPAHPNGIVVQVAKFQPATLELTLELGVFEQVVQS